MPPLAEACEVGHLAPAWTEAARAAESPTEGRCVVAAPLATAGREWSVCGGLALATGRRRPAPPICPVAPGGLAVKRVTSNHHPWAEPDAAVVLDCPGRYEVREAEGKVTVALAATGADACDRGATWPVDVSGMSARPMREQPLEVVSRLPKALRDGMVGDVTVWDDGGLVLSATAVWSGTFSMPNAGFDLQVGRDVEWQGARFVATSGAVRLSGAPVRLRSSALFTRDGAPLTLATWADLGWTSSRTWFEEVLPVRLPEARACDMRIAAGTPNALEADPAPDTARACRKAPSTPPDFVRIGPDWVLLDWNVVPEALRQPARPRDPNDWRADPPDQGCEVVCRAR